MLVALSVIGMLPSEVLDRLQGLGEVYSAQLLGHYLQSQGEDCVVLDARQVLVVSPGEFGAEVDWATSAQHLAHWRMQHPQRRVVVTGFVASDRTGRAITLVATAVIIPVPSSRRCLRPMSFTSGQMLMESCPPTPGSSRMRCNWMP